MRQERDEGERKTGGNARGGHRNLRSGRGLWRDRCAASIGEPRGLRTSIAAHVPTDPIKRRARATHRRVRRAHQTNPGAQHLPPRLYAEQAPVSIRPHPVHPGQRDPEPPTWMTTVRAPPIRRQAPRARAAQKRPTTPLTPTGPKTTGSTPRPSTPSSPAGSTPTAPSAPTTSSFSPSSAPCSGSPSRTRPVRTPRTTPTASSAASIFEHGDGTQSQGFIDLYRRGCYVLEAKQSGLSLDSTGWDKAMLRAHGQAVQYARGLPAGRGPPALRGGGGRGPQHRALQRVQPHRRRLHPLPGPALPPHPARRPAPTGDPRTSARALARPPEPRPHPPRRPGHPRHRRPTRPARRLARRRRPPARGHRRLPDPLPLHPVRRGRGPAAQTTPSPICCAPCATTPPSSCRSPATCGGR